MMKRILWKENRMSWPYGLALSASSVLIVVIGTAYTYIRHIDFITGWFMLPVIISMMFGAFSISHEKEGRTHDFAAYNTVNPDTLVLAKAVLALIYNALAAISSLIVFLIVCRPEYRDLLNPHELVTRLFQAIAINSMAWYFGFGLSIFARFETNLHTLMWGMLVAFLVPTIATYEVVRSWWILWPTWILMITPAAVILLHRQCRWRSDHKLLKPGFVLIVIASVVIAMLFGRHQAYMINHPSSKPKLICVSPDGHVALFLVTVKQSKRSASNTYWQFTDASNGNKLYRCDNANIINGSYNSKTWIGANTAVIEYFETAYKPCVRVITFQDRYHPIAHTLPSIILGSGSSDIRPSVKGDYIIMKSIGWDSSPFIRVLDVRHAKWLTEPIKVRNCWWQSDRSVGYIDAAGKRRILPLAGGKGQ